MIKDRKLGLVKQRKSLQSRWIILFCMPTCNAIWRVQNVRGHGGINALLFIAGYVG